MTKPDYRAMCAELTERLEWFIAEDETNENDPGNQYWLTGKQAGIDSVTRARALQDQPEPPSLKERALTLLKAMQSRSNLLHTVHPNIPNGWVANQVEFNLLYRALLALPEPQPVAEGPMPPPELEDNEL